MNQKNNHLAYTLNVWLCIAILAPILNLISDSIFGNSIVRLKVIGMLAFIIYFAMMSALPFYFVLRKMSKTVYEFKIPN